MHFSPVVMPLVNGAICSASLRDKPSRMCRLGVLPNHPAYRKTPSSHILRRPTLYKGYFRPPKLPPQKMTVGFGHNFTGQKCSGPNKLSMKLERTKNEKSRPHSG